MLKIVITTYIIIFSSISAYSETLNLLTFYYYPTMYDKGGELKGCAVDIVKEAFLRMGQDVSIQIIPMKRGQAMLERGQADGMFTLYKTPEREKYAIYPTMPVLTRVISLYVNKDSQITFDGNLNKMFKYSICTVLGYSYGTELDSLVKNGAFKDVTVAPNLDGTVKKLVSNRCDIMPHTKLDMIHLLKKMNYENDVKELSPSIAELPVYLAFSKKNKSLISIAEKFSDSILSMKNDGTYEKLLCSTE